jgi:hypothetical protein
MFSVPTRWKGSWVARLTGVEGALLDNNKKVGLEENASKIKCVFMPCQDKTLHKGS